MTDTDIKEIIDKNFMFLTMLGYASSIIYKLQYIIGDNGYVTDEHLLDQIGWFNRAIENIIYKNIPAPKMP